MADRPLKGLRVLEVSSGPMASIGRQLAELGAQVIQCVSDTGTPGLVQAVERIGKTVKHLSAASPKGEAEILSLLANADILILDMSEAGSLDPHALHVRFPGLIILTLTPFGLEGRCKDWQLTEPVIHALSGELSRSGIPDREPCLPPDSVAYGCSASQAVFVLLMSWWNKLRNDVGNLIDFSVFEGASLTLDPGFGIAGSASAGVPIHKTPWGRPEGRQRYPIIPCKDGHVRICVLAKRQWQSMFEWMGSPEAFSDPEYNLLHIRFRDPDLIPAIAAFFSDKTGDELEVEGEERGIPIARVYDFKDAIHSAQIKARNMFVPREILPGTTTLTSNGALEIDLTRMKAEEQPPLDAFETSAPPVCNLPKSTHPFEGLKVLDLGVIVVGAETGRLFADHGADVVKVENSTFADGMRQSKGEDLVSQTFAAGNRNKKGLGINLRSKEGLKLFKAMVAEADIVLSNFKTGTLDSLGIDFDSLKAINPRIIVADSAAFGPTGPWSRRMGYGPLVRASIGMCDLWRYEGEEEGFGDALTVHPDHLASRIGAIGVVSLLIRRLQTGEGGRVSVSQAETALNTFGGRVAEIDLARQGISLPTGAMKDHPWGVFPCSGDDDWCVITIRGDKDWQSLCAVMNRPDLTSDTRFATPEARAENQDSAEAELKNWLADKPSQEVAELLQANGIPAGAMLRVLQIPDFAGFKDRETFTEVTHPHIGETFLMERAPTRMSNIPAPEMGPAPLIGEHSRELVRDWLGLSDEAVEAHVQNGDLELAEV